MMDATPTATPCPICRNTQDNRAWVAREMMYGLRDTFTYVECGACGCLHLTDPPADLTRYYPATYYAHQTVERESRFRQWLWRIQADQAMGVESLLGALLVRYRRPRFVEWVRRANVARDARVLDVGCGRGHTLRRMRAAGWQHLTGVDPLIPGDVAWPDGVALLKRTVADLTGPYDFIMGHHSFEHVGDPTVTFPHLARLLAPDGRLLIRIPVADSEAWRTYRTNWAQLDAPRHVFLHTRRSIEHLATASGLVIETVTYDSNGFQFWGSEQYGRDIALVEAVARGRADGCLLSRRERAEYERRARALNVTRGADSACFYLRHSGQIYTTLDTRYTAEQIGVNDDGLRL